MLGTTSRGAKGALLLGTTAERVIHLSPCPVAVVPHGYRRPEGGVKVIGAAYTPKPEAEDALPRRSRSPAAGVSSCAC